MFLLTAIFKINAQKTRNPISTKDTQDGVRSYRFEVKQEMSLKKTNGVGLKKEENITQARLSTCT